MPLIRNSDVCAAELDGEVCLFHPENAQYLNLNATASAIWNVLEQPTDRSALVAELIARYAVDEPTCLHDTEAFLTRALELGMLLEGPT